MAATRFQRWDAKVDRNGPIPAARPDLGHCWIWTGAIDNGTGYGRFKSDKPVAELAHRWSHEWHVGPIPDGMTVDHLCLVHACVNPNHFDIVTREVNARRGNPNTSKTHCKRGHAFDAANTIQRNNGSRECRACKQTHNRTRRNADLKAA